MPINEPLTPIEWHLLFQSMKENGSVNSRSCDFFGDIYSPEIGGSANFLGYSEWDNEESRTIAEWAASLGVEI